MKIFIFLSGLLMSTTACSQTKIDKAKFLTLMKTPAAKILDVRTPSEFSEQFLSLCEKQIPKKATVLVYCAAGGRSEQACRVLKKAGYTVLYDLKGGYDAW
jgi:rhodanese-related sulfurtransferase